MIEGALASEVSHCVATGLRVVARIPCYNEEVTIGPTVAAFCGALPLATVCAYDNNRARSRPPPSPAVRAVSSFPVGEVISRLRSNDGYGADSGPSRGERRRRAIRPIEASKAAIGNGCFTSTPDIVSGPRHPPLSALKTLCYSVQRKRQGKNREPCGTQEGKRDNWRLLFLSIGPGPDGIAPLEDPPPGGAARNGNRPNRQATPQGGLCGDRI